MGKMVTALRRWMSVLVTLAFTGVRAVEQNCGQQELTLCAKPLQVLSDTSDLNFVSKKEELDLLCPDLRQGLRCIKSYTRRCMSPEMRMHFTRLYNGTDAAVHELCNPGPYQQRFLLHAPCLKGLKPQYERCAATYQAAVTSLSQNTTPEGGPPTDKLRTVCCSFQAYMGCSERAVLARCGEESAAFTREFLHRMADTMMKTHCSEFSEGSEECSGYSGGSVFSLQLLSLLVPLMAYLHTTLRLQP